MPVLSVDQLTQFCEAEGRVGGSAWYDYDDVAPYYIKRHRDFVFSEIEPLTAGWSKETIEGLQDVFDNAVGANRAQFGKSVELEEISGYRVRHRLDTILDVVLDEACATETWFFEPSHEVLNIVARMASEPTATVVLDDVLAIHSELGRLCGPLWILGAEDDWPPTVDRAILALVEPLAPRFENAHVFDHQTSTYLEGDYATCSVVFLQAVGASMAWSRVRYFKTRPIALELPTNGQERRIEEGRRAAAREAVIEKVNSALAQIVEPLVDAFEDASAAFEQACKLQEAQEREERAAAGFPHPGPQPFGVSPRGAELWVRDVLRYMGAVEAEATQATADGGVDVICNTFVVSVKNYAGMVPVEEVREIFAVAATQGKHAVLWTSGTVTSAGLEFANVAPVAIVRYEVETTEVTGVNREGELFLGHIQHRPPVELGWGAQDDGSGE